MLRPMRIIVLLPSHLQVQVPIPLMHLTILESNTALRAWRSALFARIRSLSQQ